MKTGIVITENNMLNVLALITETLKDKPGMTVRSVYHINIHEVFKILKKYRKEKSFVQKDDTIIVSTVTNRTFTGDVPKVTENHLQKNSISVSTTDGGGQSITEFINLGDIAYIDKQRIFVCKPDIGTHGRQYTSVWQMK